MDDVRQGIDGGTMTIGIVHEDDQVAMEIRPQLQLLLDVFHFFIGRLARPVGIASQSIPADFDVADIVNGRPEILGEVAFRTARSPGNDGPDTEYLINLFFRLQEFIRIGIGRNVYFLIIMRIRMDADGIAGLIDFLDHIGITDDILAGQEKGSMNVFFFQDVQNARRILIVRSIIKGQIDDLVAVLILPRLAIRRGQAFFLALPGRIFIIDRFIIIDRRQRKIIADKGHIGLAGQDLRNRDMPGFSRRQDAVAVKVQEQPQRSQEEQ